MCLFGTGSEAISSLGVLHLFRGASEVAEAGTGSYGEEQTWREFGYVSFICSIWLWNAVIFIEAAEKPRSQGSGHCYNCNNFGSDGKRWAICSFTEGSALSSKPCCHSYGATSFQSDPHWLDWWTTWWSEFDFRHQQCFCLQDHDHISGIFISVTVTYFEGFVCSRLLFSFLNKFKKTFKISSNC